MYQGSRVRCNLLTLPQRTNSTLHGGVMALRLDYQCPYAGPTVCCRRLERAHRPSEESTRHILGQFGVGQRWENWFRLSNFAKANRSVICSRCFQVPKKHHLRWRSNNRHTTHQITHVLLASCWTSSMENRRVFRGLMIGDISNLSFMFDWPQQTWVRFAWHNGAAHVRKA